MVSTENSQVKFSDNTKDYNWKRKRDTDKMRKREKDEYDNNIKINIQNEPKLILAIYNYNRISPTFKFEIDNILRESPEEILKQDSNGYTALMVASDLGLSNIVNSLLQKNNTKEHLLLVNNNKETALIIACKITKELMYEDYILYTVKELLKWNSSYEYLSMKDKDGNTALMHACMRDVNKAVNSCIRY